MSSMKGFVFTLDALFALVIAGLGITMLLYLQYSSQLATQSPLQEAYGLLQSTMQQNIASSCNNVSLGSVGGCTQVSGMPSIGFGTYTVKQYQSTLQAMADLYMSPQYGPYATALFEALYPSTNTSIFINNEYAPAIGLKTASFNGTNSYIDTGAGASNMISNAFAVSVWMNPTAPPSSGEGLVAASGYEYGMTEYSDGNVYAYIGDGTHHIQTPVANSVWYNLVEVYDGNALTLYKNGALAAGPLAVSASPSSSSDLKIGYTAGYFNGNISNVQIYNAALSAAQVRQLYTEGITGTPVLTSNVVGWWPLDGNANDYSVNGNNGTASNVVYDTSLSGTYMPASLEHSALVSKASAPLMLNVSGTHGIYNVSVVVWR